MCKAVLYSTVASSCLIRLLFIAADLQLHENAIEHFTDAFADVWVIDTVCKDRTEIGLHVPLCVWRRVSQ